MELLSSCYLVVTSHSSNPSKVTHGELCKRHLYLSVPRDPQSHEWFLFHLVELESMNTVVLVQKRFRTDSVLLLVRVRKKDSVLCFVSPAKCEPGVFGGIPEAHAPPVGDKPLIRCLRIRQVHSCRWLPKFGFDIPDRRQAVTYGRPRSRLAPM